MLNPRWIKVTRDVGLSWRRVLMMVLAIAAGVFGLGTMLSSYTLLDREVTRSYLATNPASAALELENIDDALLAAVRERPGILAAQAGTRLGARIEARPGQWMPLLLFVVSDFKEMRINTLYPESGAWPPPPGSLLIERDAMAMLGAHVGDKFQVKLRDGSAREMTVAGTVHDPSQPPASSGMRVYGYVGAQGTPLSTLSIRVKDAPMDAAAVEGTATALATWLTQQGHAVKSVSVPPPGQHPHQVIMSSLMRMLVLFSALALCLSAVLSASMIGSLLAQQRRQIGVMKAVGARSWQIGRMYLVMVGAIGIGATAIGMPLGLAAGRAFAKVVLIQILNFSMESDAVPHWVLLALVASGVLIPLLAAAFPIRRATGMPVRAAIDDVGVGAFGNSRIDRFLSRLRGVDRSLLLALRNSVRQRARLAFTLGLLAMAGAMFMASLNLKGSSEQHLVDAAEARRYDMEVALSGPADEAKVQGLIGAVAGVAQVQSWNGAMSARTRSDGLVVDHTYPDGGHGSLSVSAVPDGSTFMGYTLEEGAWLDARATDGVVLNGGALHSYPGIAIGDPVELTVRGKPATLRLAGIVRQNMVGATAYVTPATLAAITGVAGRSARYRVVASVHDEAFVAALASRVEAALGGAGISTGVIVTEAMLRKEVNGHFDMLVAAMIFIAILMAAVGVLGLASAMGNNVSERAREFGIMRTIGGTPRKLMRNIVTEGLFVGAMSYVLALVLCVPLSVGLAAFLGNMLFDFPLPLVLLPKAAGLWLLLVLAGAALASAWPARKAAHLSIRETLAYL